MKPEKRFGLALIGVVVVILLAGCWYGISRYRQSVRCREARNAFLVQVEQMTRNANSQLAAGKSRDDVTRFFAANGIPMRIEAMGDHQEATGTLRVPAPKGCASAACVSGAGQIRVMVELDAQGTVMAPGFVFATGANCM